MSDTNIGLLKVDVKSPQVIAGQKSIVNLLIRNPFPHAISIESIEAPNSSILKEENRYLSIIKKLFKPNKNEISDSTTTSVIQQSLQIKPLTAFFIHELSNELIDPKEPKSPEENKHLIQSGQEDIAFFEIETADWLLTKPTTVELYAMIKYKINTEHKSQIVPIVLQIQPPVLSIITGTLFGGTLGHLARHLTSNDPAMMSVSLLAVLIMSLIAAIILAKREDSNKGFITLEDFYGAFFIGVMIGYMGTEYFESILSGVSDFDINKTKEG